MRNLIEKILYSPTYPFKYFLCPAGTDLNDSKGRCDYKIDFNYTMFLILVVCILIAFTPADIFNIGEKRLKRKKAR